MKTLYIISGANKGLGRAFYDILVADKVRNIVVSLSRRIADDQSCELSKKNRNFYFYRVDLSSFKDPSSLKTIRKFKKVIDKVVFINNAGVIEPLGLIGQLDMKKAYKAVHVNAVAPTLLLNYFLKAFDGKNIDVVNISTGAAVRSIEGWSIYCSSKAFTKMLFETLEKENMGNDRLRVFQFDPGVIDSDMQQTIRQTKSFPWQKEFIDLKNSGKLKSPTEAAERILNEIHSI